jgi:hypothetical protein
MRERLAARLKTLRDEHESGRRMLADLDARREDLHQTLLRISGAIQVVEELLTDEEAQGSAAGQPAVHVVPSARS